MNQREAKADSCRIVARLIESYMDVGQPWQDHDCDTDQPCGQCDRRAKALCQIRDEMRRRGGQ